MKRNFAFLFVIAAGTFYLILNTQAATAQTATVKNYSPVSDTVKVKAAVPAFKVDILQDASSEKFILLIDNPLQQRLSISVRSVNGEGYLETTSELSLRKRFSMTEAEDGFYIVTVSNGKNTITRKMQLSTTTLVTRNIAVF